LKKSEKNRGKTFEVASIILYNRGNAERGKASIMSNPNNNNNNEEFQEFQPEVLEDLMNDPDFEDHIDVPCGDAGQVVGSDDDLADLFTEDGGLTAGAYEMLAKWDANGVFV
jgi:hypothetical protein